MIGEVLLLAAVTLFIWAFYRWVTLNNEYFERRHVKHMKPNFFVGNTGGFFLQKYNAIEFSDLIYKTFPNESIYGMFDFRMPQFVVRNPEIIKQIGVKDFEFFEDHRSFADEKVDAMWGNSLFLMRGEKWRQMRATLSPAFTGSKMRQMFELVSECADDVVKHFLGRVANGEQINVEMKDFFSRYTNDVIASCAFGIKINSLSDPENEFYMKGKTIMDFSGIKKIAQIIITNKLPLLARALKLKMVDDFFAKTFKNLILETMEVRKSRNIFRPDMINILMQVREGSLKYQSDEKSTKEKEGFATVEESHVGQVSVSRKWSDDEIVAQCFLFFLAGFETSSTLLTFTSHELVANPEIQQKLYEEIRDVNDQLDGKRINYDILQKMKYLDQFICETLRKWPPAIQVDRVCVKDYTFDNGEGLKFKVEKGTAFLFPIFGIQHDPNYFPEPEKFDPERFSDENKNSIQPGTYIPFGIGPRNCIGSRFALMEVKAILYYLLLNFSFVANEKTENPLELKKIPFSLSLKNGMHLELKPRKNMIGELLLLIGIALISYAIYTFIANSSRYFEQRNVKYKGISFTLSNLYSMFSGKFNAFGQAQTLYNACPDDPVYGVFDFSIRQYIFRDPEAYKRIAIKDFEFFEDHRVLIDEKTDALFGNSLIALHGEKWRQMRATLSPAFTGSKMRLMFALVSECADEIMKHFLKQTENGEKINIEMKDFFSRYTNDVIASCAFGVKVNSFTQPDNEFFLNGKKLMNFTSFTTSVKFIITLVIPKLAKLLKIRLIDATLSNDFKYMILDTMTMRENNNIHRPDMINMLMQVREGSLQYQSEEKSNETTEGFATVEESEIGKINVARKWNDDELVAQCFLFFLAGFESAATALTFAAHELLINPDIQQKLYQEIADVNEQLNGKRISYDTLQKMKYLDQVVSETLRKWPIAVQTDRTCVKDYVYDDGELKFEIEKGSNILFPVYGLHHDPKYYPDPEKFDPERFNDDNKHDILPGTYVPFGLGPRNCIGSRFALMELKAILYYLLLNFSFEPNKDTQIPLKMKKGFFLVTEKGVNLELKPRNHK
ncbi:uncharacterized protein LOC116341517 [Contarinia nasturtii]|uniref:uncharacterized protein LOC116341517 n=1 Tax=Contarinia nasturtii TaxID=265458 RepID=UPI0012D38A45|nr:uncharacterized protein LOC116341517 [Contarinia nasturtii]